MNSRTMGWAGHLRHMEETRNAYRILVGKPDERISLQRLKVE
jgi:hypothetical protein